MIRSKRKTPKRAVTTSTTEKGNKQKANRILRKKVKIQLLKGHSVLSILKEVSDVWNFDKDGKIYLKQPTPKDIRK